MIAQMTRAVLFAIIIASGSKLGSGRITLGSDWHPIIYQGSQMVDLKHSDMRIIDEAFQGEPGYALNFSDRTFTEYFDDEFGIDRKEYRGAGTSKMNRLRTFFRVSDPALVSRVMRSLCEYREGYRPFDPKVRERIYGLIARIEGGSEIARTDALDRFVPDETLEELIGSIERDIAADRPAAALDRLHTYCAKKFGHLLDKRGVEWSRNEPLHSRVGKYVKVVNEEQPLQEMTLQILKNAIGVFDKFNHIRNNQTLAHDNDLLHKAEARFIFDSVNAVLRFIKSVDTGRFED
jgi:hypothetical protein